jgi:luciferase family oxidoreductase group 1
VVSGLVETKRNVAALAACQGLLITNNITVISIGSLTGFMLAANKALSTLPATAYILGGALSTYPISLFMRRHGRRSGFTLGALAGLLGAAVCTAAVGLHSFWLFCLGTLIAGAYNASGGYYRFAAADISTEQFKSKAIALVLAGGMLGGILGPESSKLTKDWLPTAFIGLLRGPHGVRRRGAADPAPHRHPPALGGRAQRAGAAPARDRAPAGIRGGLPERGHRLRGDEPADGRHTARHADLRAALRLGGSGDPVAHRRDVRAGAVRRSSGAPLRCGAHHGGRRDDVRDLPGGRADRPEVAEVFRMYEALFPGRVDLGIGRAPGGNLVTARAMNAEAFLADDRFPTQVQELVGYLDDTLPPEYPFHTVKAMPSGPSSPEVWLLGSSDYSGALASHLGLRFAFAHFINAQGGDAVMRGYRTGFRASYRERRPYAMLAVFVICAPTLEQAEALAASIDLRRYQMSQGIEAPVATMEEARAYVYSEQAKAIVQRERAVIGTPESVQARLLALQEQFAADELMVITITGDCATRLRCYELLAAAFGLSAAQ